MSLGLSNKLNILTRSPHDSQAAKHPLAPMEVERKPTEHWVASRYTIRATADDGRLVLWNTLSGKMTVIKAEDRERVLGLLTRTGFESPKEGIVDYLVERGYLVRKGVDEYRKFQHLFGQQHYRTDLLELILMPSEDCNFRCTYCYEDFARGTMTPEVREGIKNLVRKRISKLASLNISWFGGEPLYGWEAVEELAPFFVEIADENQVPFTAHMTTNGYLLTPEIADKLLAWRINNFQITLDGLAEHHNHSRVARDGSPTFEQIFNNLKAMAQREDYFHISLRVNYDRNNAPGLSQFVDQLSQEFGGDPRFHLLLKAVGKWGGANDANLDVCGGNESERIRQELMAQAKEQGLHFGSIRDAAKLGSHVCYAARPYNFLIGAAGQVMKCTIVLDKSDYNIVGKITPQGELILDDDRMGIWTEPAFEKDSQCQKCVVLPSCQGISCPLVRIEDDTRPCIGARKNAKAELTAVLETQKAKGRVVKINTTEPAVGVTT